MSRASGRFTVLHVSDVHATEDGALYGAVDGLERLEQAGRYARSVGATPEAVIVTGDLAQRGNQGAYPRLAEACGRLEHTVGAPVLTVLGNHDDPAASRILPGHSGGSVRLVHVDGFRIALLDSHTGSLGSRQLSWLRAALAEPYGWGTIIGVHHAPLDSPLPTLHDQGLHDAEELMDVLAGTDARAVLAGHFHHALTAEVRGIPVFVGPALAYHQVMDAGPGSMAGHDLPMFSLVQFTRNGVSATPVGLHTPSPLFTQRIAEPIAH